MNIQRLKELEKIAFNNGDSLRAEIIQELIDTKLALENLIETGEKLDQTMDKEIASAPNFLEAGAFVFWAHDVALDNFRDALNASTLLLNK